jgi:hypothetical protein
MIADPLPRAAPRLAEPYGPGELERVVPRLGGSCPAEP